MGDVNALLDKRIKKSSDSSKMTKMAQQSAAGNLSSFSGLFSISELTGKETDFLEALLNEFATGQENVSLDLRSLVAITAEVKAINNQAAILHGERIKKAQKILTKYRDGAFTGWLIAAYGNRQTPYNFLRYYEFYEAMPRSLHPQIELMPRQAIYTLASREGSLKKKRDIVENYEGETKAEVLALIRERFPLGEHDQRGENVGERVIQTVKRLCEGVRKQNRPIITRSQKKAIFDLLDHLVDLVDGCRTR